MVALSMKAGQFVGYVAATIDGNKDLQECAKKNYLNDIAGKSARLFASAPPNRSHSSHLNLMIAISMVCADTK